MYGGFALTADFVGDMIREFEVDGVIGERLQFCDAWGFENFMLHKEFADTDTPFLVLEREYLLSGVGQMRTRVQAFLETIEGGK